MARNETRTVRPPVAMGTISTGTAFAVQHSSPVSSRVRGVSYVGTVAGSGYLGPMANQIGAMVALNPATFGDRLAAYSKLFDKYVYHSVRLTYTPIVSTGVSGNVSLTIDRDPMDPADDPGNMAQILSNEVCSSGPVYAKQTVSIFRDPNEKRTYFINPHSPDPEESEQFIAYAYLFGTTVVATYGLLSIEYDLELISPVFNQIRTVEASQYASRTILFGSSHDNGWWTTPGFVPLNAGSVLMEITISNAVIADDWGARWGANGPSATITDGMKLYLRSPTDQLSNAWYVYRTLSDALASGPSNLIHVSASDPSSFSASVYCRPVANTSTLTG